MKKLKFTGLALIALLLGAGSLCAQASAEDGLYKPNRKITEPTREQYEELGYTGVLPQSFYQIAFVHDAAAKEGDLVLRILMPIPVQGCVKMMNFETEQEIQGPALIIDIDFPIVIPDYKTKDQINCNKSNTASVDTHIDRNELIEKGVKELRLKTKHGVTVFEMEITPHVLKLKPKDILKKKIEYWSLPKNAVILSVPMSKGDLMDNSAQLQQLARAAQARGLKPIEEELPEYTPGLNRENRFYFLDTKGDVSALLEESGGAISIGQVNSTEAFYGPDGLYDKIIPMDVMAMLPDDRD